MTVAGGPLRAKGEVNRWRTRPLKPFYPFSFVDCIYVSMRTERGIRPGRWRKGYFPERHRTALHRPSRTKLDSVYPQKAVECFHEAAERDLWCCKREACPFDGKIRQRFLRNLHKILDIPQ
jgi:hypothetical protein